jgi:hypothetical protein
MMASMDPLLSRITIDPAVWGRNFPREYDGYLRTVDNERSQQSGSESFAPSKRNGPA